jgi:cytochrome c biogenesis protein CcmG, thiol:disulfide interchange protein DsbE
MSNLDFLQDSPTSPPRRRWSLGTLVLLVGIASVAIVVALALARRQQGPLESGAAPDFTVTTFDGQTLRLSDLRGQVVLVNFWASWCLPCREEAPELEAIWQQYRAQGVTVVGIAWSDIEADTLAFMDEFNMTYPNAPDLGTRIGDDYGIRAVPETYIIDQQGEVQHRLIGSENITVENLSAIIDGLLANA